MTVSDTTTAIPTTSDESLSNVAEAAHSLSSNIFSSVTELFQGKVVVHSPASSNSIHHLFFPIHSGTANVHFSVEGADLVVPMQVTNCGAGDCTPQLGTSRPDFDDLLMQYADRNGIPPQLLKAQIQQESGFNPNAYRYEPLSVDFAQITAPNRGGIAFGALRQAALAPWALATSNNCSTILQPQGANLDLASDDATARQKYSLSLAPNGTTTLCRLANAFQTRPTRPINASDTLPSMENVFYTNDNNASPNNWEIIATKAGSKTPQRFYDYQVDFPPFTAQTVIAASYGLHQLLYPTAVREGYKAQNGIGLSPGNLFDPATSLDLGTEYLAQQFKISRTQELTDYQDVTEDTFQFQFAPALARYNGNRITVPDAQNNCSQALIAPPVGQKNPLAAYVYTCRIINNAPIFDPVPLPPANNGGGGGGTPQN